MYTHRRRPRAAWLPFIMADASGAKHLQMSISRSDFEQLIDPETLVTVVRHIDPQSDFHKLARFLETHVNE